MKIGKPTSTAPAGAERNKRWAEVWAAASKLKSGEWLPVKFDDDKEAKALARQATNAKSRGLVLRKRGNTVFVGKVKQ